MNSPTTTNHSQRRHGMIWSNGENSCRHGSVSAPYQIDCSGVRHLHASATRPFVLNLFICRRSPGYLLGRVFSEQVALSIGGTLVEAVDLIDDIERPLLDLLIDSANIFADDPQANQLHASEK